MCTHYMHYMHAHRYHHVCVFIWYYVCLVGRALAEESSEEWRDAAHNVLSIAGMESGHPQMERHQRVLE